ncbi:MAG: hypothetical protein MZW92_81925 [Comamonadaceae bacterium]|nr:hypothetical protein [Comamonadaceae bacterium]
MAADPTRAPNAAAVAAPPAGPLAMVGLGRMGANMARRLARGGVERARRRSATPARAPRSPATARRHRRTPTLDEAVAALPCAAHGLADAAGGRADADGARSRCSARLLAPATS